MIDAAKISTLKQYLRRTNVGDDGLAKLKALADTLFGSATNEVTITGNSFEGGTASGVVTFPKMAYLQAVEELILELDPTNTPTAPDQSAIVDFSYRRVKA